MPRTSLLNALQKSQNVLKAAILRCERLPDRSERLQTTILNYSLSCLSIEQIVDVVKKSAKLQQSTAKDSKLLEAHLKVAQNSLDHIPDVIAPSTCITFKQRPRQRCRNLSDYVLLHLYRIVTAVHATTLLVSL